MGRRIDENVFDVADVVTLQAEYPRPFFILCKTDTTRSYNLLSLAFFPLLPL